MLMELLTLFGLYPLPLARMTSETEMKYLSIEIIIFYEIPLARALRLK